jgi:hypothetical protein
MLVRLCFANFWEHQQRRNPVREKWMLAEEPHKYKYSSASYYHTGVDEFGFLENYMNACDEDEW